MGVFFGTDGLRGKTNDDLSVHIAYKCGNALASIQDSANILIGTDTRKSGELFALGFMSGAVNAGANVSFVGVCATAGVSFLTKTKGFDFGVVISASHNPAEYNGIKIFDKNGTKINEKQEQQIERLFLKEKIKPFNEIGSITFDFSLVNDYYKFLSNAVDVDLLGKTIVLDSANGTASKISKKLFESKGAKVFSLFDQPDGVNINKDCGALYVDSLIENVKNHHADFGFAFDGDSDRLIAVDEKGEVVDGDQILYIFSKYFFEKELLIPSAVVGTRHTNSGVEKSLNEFGIKLIRTDIGDKYVNLQLEEKGLILGGEQSGHIFVKSLMPTGDGVLNALLLSKIVTEQNKKLSQLKCKNVYIQTNINVEVKDKFKVINSEILSSEIERHEKSLKNSGRIMVRISGTEPYVRVMVECKNKKKSKEIAEKIVKTIQKINGDFDLCVE